MGSIIHGTPKRHIPARKDAIWRTKHQDRCKDFGASLSEVPTNEKMKKSLVKTILPIRGSKILERIVMKFRLKVGLPDVVIHAKLGDDRFNHFCMVFGERRNFRFSHWLWLSYWQHSGTTVPVCDYYLYTPECIMPGRIKQLKWLEVRNVISEAILQKHQNHRQHVSKYVKRRLSLTGIDSRSPIGLADVDSSESVEGCGQRQ